MPSEQSEPRAKESRFRPLLTPGPTVTLRPDPPAPAAGSVGPGSDRALALCYPGGSCPGGSCVAATRVITAAVGVVELVVIGLGVAPATVWRPDDVVVATTPASGHLVVTDPGVLELGDGPVTIRATTTGGDPVVLAIGRDTDVAAWVGTDAHVQVTGLASWSELEVTDVKDTTPAPSPAPADRLLPLRHPRPARRPPRAPTRRPRSTPRAPTSGSPRRPGRARRPSSGRSRRAAGASSP